MLKVMVLLCLLFGAVPVPVSAKTVEKQATREVYFHLADGLQGGGDITITLSDGSQINLGSSNGWECRRMFLENGVEVEKVEGGKLSGGIGSGEVIIEAEDLPSVHNREKIEVKEAADWTGYVVFASVAAVLILVAGLAFFVIRG